MSDIVATAQENQWNLEHHVARLQAAFRRALREEDLTAIARKLIEQAREGDRTSARLVLKYGLGQLMGVSLTDWVLERESKKATKTPRPAPLTPDQVMAAIQLKAQEQQALHDEIVGRRPPGSGNGRGTPPTGGR